MVREKQLDIMELLVVSNERNGVRCSTNVIFIELKMSAVL